MKHSRCFGKALHPLGERLPFYFSSANLTFSFEITKCWRNFSGYNQVKKVNIYTSHLFLTLFAKRTLQFSIITFQFPHHLRLHP